MALAYSVGPQRETQARSDTPKARLTAYVAFAYFIEILGVAVMMGVLLYSGCVSRAFRERERERERERILDKNLQVFAIPSSILRQASPKTFPK